MRTEIRFAGYGGQGIALMGMLFGKAASIHDQKEAVFTQSYGPESRGGASCADVVLDNGRVDFPLITKPKFLVTMFQEAYRSYRPLLDPQGVLCYDQDLVHFDKGDVSKAYPVAATKMAEELGKTIVANVVMLGFFTAVSQTVRREAVEAAIKSTVRPRFVDLNLKAFERGFVRGREMLR